MNNQYLGTLEIELLPARHGDAILLTWGPEDDRRRLLIDGGPALAYDAIGARLAEVARESRLELLVLTHVDGDHIEGSILLVNDAQVACDVHEVWFNGPAQLDELGGEQGEMFAALVGARGIPMNARFGGKAVRTPDPDDPVEASLPLPVVVLDGGLTLTVLAPDRRALMRLRTAWTATCEDEGFLFATPQDALDALRKRKTLVPADQYLGPEDFPRADEVAELADKVVAPDTKAANGSSIVLLVEYGGVRVLLAGDATPPGLLSGLKRLLAERDLDTLELTAFKLPHHGSARNITRDILRLVPAERYLFSSDGGYFGHPDAIGIARCLVFGRRDAELVFNYRSAQTLLWDDELLLAGAQASFPAEGGSGMTVSLPWRPTKEIPS